MANSVLLDTHVLLWLAEGDSRLGTGSRARAESAFSGGVLSVSALSFWEVAMLVERGRIELAHPVANWRRDVLDTGVTEVAVAGDIAIAAAYLEGFHRDPADRVIAATARLRGHTLLTADDRILGWSGELARIDARD